jgi:hypothetical protein
MSRGSTLIGVLEPLKTTIYALVSAIAWLADIASGMYRQSTLPSTKLIRLLRNQPLSKEQRTDLGFGAVHVILTLRGRAKPKTKLP